jgi:two-component system OmpR family sensor kinase
VKTLSLRNRLTWWYTLVLLMALSISGAAVVWMQGRISIRRVDSELADVETTMLKIVSNELREHASLEEAVEEATDTVGEGRLATAVLDTHGAQIVSRLAGLNPGDLLRVSPEEGAATIRTASGAWRVRSHLENVGQAGVVLFIAKPLADVDLEQRELREAMLVGIPIALLLAGAGGWWLASIGLAPITDMARRAVQLPLTGSDDLGESARRDELGQLSGAFNGLVARLRAALQTERQFMADASHELRTPVSIIRSAAEVALSRDRRDENEYRETIAIAGDQARRLGRLVEDMLVLARADAGGYPVRVKDLDLDEVIGECRRAVKALAAERGVQVQSAAGPEVPFRGDEDLLRRLVLNLLQNAIQHTPAGGSIGVTVEPSGDAVKIRVADGGPGIPEVDRARIFDRFVRLDEARTGSGTGLGLPIARWIAEVHGGTLVLEASGPRGSTFCATLGNPAR